MTRTLLYASAAWCGPCKAMKPLAEKLATEAGVTVEHLDIEASPKRAYDLKVMSLPTLILLENGEEKARLTGKTPPDRLRAFLAPGA